MYEGVTPKGRLIYLKLFIIQVPVDGISLIRERLVAIEHDHAPGTTQGYR